MTKPDTLFQRTIDDIIAERRNKCEEEITPMRDRSEQGSAEAAYALYVYFLTSDHRDLSEAKKWLHKAAEQGHEEAKKRLER